MDKFTELEYKYRADNVGLQQFKDLMKEVGYLRSLTVSSWDLYFTNNTEENFIRLRESPVTPELTIKRKTKDSNNWNRKEVDIPLSASRFDRQAVEEFVALEGYEENFRIYKSCFIYFLEYVNYVYYIVYDEQMTEKGRFIEVEVNKDKLENWYPSWTTPPDTLKRSEQKLEVLGITNKNRLKKSLFEMFRRVK